MTKATRRKEACLDCAGDILSKAAVPKEKSKEFKDDKRNDMLDGPGPLILKSPGQEQQAFDEVTTPGTFYRAIRSKKDRYSSIEVFPRFEKKRNREGS